MLSRPSVLFSPSHYFTGHNVGGSEYQWPFELVSALSTYLESGIVVTGEVRNGVLPSNIQCEEVWRDQTVDFESDRKRLHFVWNCYVRSLMTARRAVPTIHHHLLPWGSQTFNPLILLRGTPLGDASGTKVIIGPIQTPHEVTFAEGNVAGVLNRDFSLASTRNSTGKVSPASPLSQAASALSVATLRRADALVAITDDAKKMLEEMGIRKPVWTIPAGIAASAFPYVRRPESNKTTKLLTTCYLLKRKGVDLIIKAVAQLKSMQRDVELVIVGDGPERAVLEHEVREMAVDDCVSFAGFVEHSALLKYYHNADIWISMSWAESFGVSLLEAMSTGLPAISAANTGARSIIEDRLSGFLVPLGDAASLALTIERIIRDRSLLREVGIAAHKRVMENFDWNIIARRYARMYDEVRYETM